MDLISKSESSPVGAIVNNIVPVAIAGIIGLLGAALLGPIGMIIAGGIVMAMFHTHKIGPVLGAVMMLSGFYGLFGRSEGV